MQKATDAKTNTDNAQIKERIQLAYTAAIADGHGDLTEPNLRAELTNEFGDDYDLDEDTTTNEWIISVNEVERLRVNKGTKENPVEDNWIIAWTYDENNGWSGNITDHSTQLNGIIVAKLYETGNTITPDGYDEGSEYYLEIDGYDSGIMGVLLANSMGIKIAGVVPAGPIIVPQAAWRSSENRNICAYITRIVVNSGVVEIARNAFSYFTSLNSVTLYNGVTTIGSDAFSDCNNLSSITIPNSITTIGANAFKNCNNLQTINYLGTEEQFDEISIDWEGNGILGDIEINFQT